MLSRLPAGAKRKCIIFINFQWRRGGPKWRFSNFPRFWKNSSALGSFNCIFENNSLKALFGQNMKKLNILKLSPDSRYLQKLALKILTGLQGFLVIFLSIFGLVFFVFKSLLGIARQWSRKNFAILTLKPRSHVRIQFNRSKVSYWKCAMA